ncbi:MAG: membrane dipeptidase, partial [Caldilineaceae bacterium]|nr:membrane dipeptidase [Caldilineaceae bacterium]
PKLRQGGVKCIWLSEGGPGEVTVDPEPKARSTVAPNTRPTVRTVFRGPAEVQRILRGFDATRRLCQQYPDDLELATSARQIRDIATRGKIAVLLHTEALLIADDLAMLRSYHALGLRVSGLVHAAPLDWIDCDREQRIGGLSELGRQVVHEMNRLGIVIDISHAAEEAIHTILAESTQPIVASHANVKHFSPLMRNLTDAVARGIADGGGVVGIHCSSAFVDIQCLEGRSGGSGSLHGAQRLDLIGKILTPGVIDPFQFEADQRAKPGFAADAVFPTVHLERLIDVVDYLVNLVGIDHVGIGTDFQYLEDAVDGFNSAAQTPNVTAALLQRGYSATAVEKILGENFLRVIEDVVGE